MITYKAPNKKLEPVTAEMYKSWGNSAYSPKGTLTFDFSDLDYLEPKDKKAVKQALKNTDSEFVLKVECELQYNKFINLKLTAYPVDNFDLDLLDLMQMMWLLAWKEFDYKITNIFLIDKSPETIKDYKKNRWTNKKGLGGSETLGYTRDISKVLMATEYLQYLNYLPTSSHANWLMAEPEYYLSSYNKWIKPRTPAQKETTKKKYSTFTTLLSRIPAELYERQQGRQGGKLSTQAQLCLYDFLVWTEQKISKDEIMKTFVYDYSPTEDKE
tara:strand:- start:4828 stop:5640 length:813 start_codon:yes stop_codon:yes gene_type:complete